MRCLQICCLLLFSWLLLPSYANEQTVQPDSRIGAAIAGLNRLYPDQEPVRLDSSGDKPLLKQLDNVVYRFENQDFQNVFQGVKQAALALMQKTPSSSGQSLAEFSTTTFSPQALIAIITDNNVAAKHDDNALQKLTQALIVLSFFSPDHADNAHVVQSDSLMALALLEARTGVRDAVLLAMLADNLGYLSAAQSSASLLTEHPLNGLYGDNVVMGESVFTDLLRIKQAARRQNAQQWLSAVNHLAGQDIDLSLLFYDILSVENDEIRSKLLLLYPLIIYRDYQEENPVKPLLFNENGLNVSIENIDRVSSALSADLTFNPAFLIENFERVTAEQDTLPNVGLLSSDVLVNYWQSRLFNAYYDIAVYLVKTDYNHRLAGSLLQVFQGNASAKMGKQLATWFAAMNTDTLQSVTEQSQILADNVNPQPTLLLDLYDKQQQLKPFDNKTRQDLQQTALTLLDTRPRHRMIRQIIHYPNNVGINHSDWLAELPVTERLLTHILATQNSDEVKKLLSRQLMPSVQSRLIAWLFEQGEGSDALYQQLLSLYAAFPDNFAVSMAYVKVLNIKKETGAATTALDKWITKRHGLSRQAYLQLVMLMAQTKQVAGDTQSAWETIAPIAEYPYPQTKLAGIDMALANNDNESANALFSAYRQRFPDTLTTLAYQLRLRLQAKDYQGAAKTYQNVGQSLNDKQFQQVIETALDGQHISMLSQKHLQRYFAEIPISKSQQQLLQQALLR